MIGLPTSSMSKTHDLNLKHNPDVSVNDEGNADDATK